MNLVKKFALLLTFASLLVVFSGCAALIIGGAAGAGGVAFLEGALQSKIESPIPEVMRATKAANEKLMFQPVSDSSDALQGEVKARDSSNRLIDIKMKRETDRMTSISIRIGVFGDEKASIVVLDEIKKQLLL